MTDAQWRFQEPNSVSGEWLDLDLPRHWWHRRCMSAHVFLVIRPCQQRRGHRGKHAHWVRDRVLVW